MPCSQHCAYGDIAQDEPAHDRELKWRYLMDRDRVNARFSTRTALGSLIKIFQALSRKPVRPQAS